MHVMYERCAGLDVHKKTVVACVLTAEGQETRTFGTMTADLLTLSDWLQACGCTYVAMESTGDYWKPVFNILEGAFEVLLVNAQHVKAVPGRKTDVKDAAWLAELLQHGLLRASFIPPVAQRELRDLTRYRSTFICERVTLGNRVQKLLEDANIKLASVASDIMGVSGQAILAALLAGHDDPHALADLAKGQHLVLEYRGAAGQHERLPALAAELVRLKVDVIVTQGTPAALAAKDATTTIPIVMVGVADPVGSGLVASLARPGGNVTGLSTLSPELVGKQLELLKDMLPTVSRVAVLRNPTQPAHAPMVWAADGAAPALDVQLHLVEARGPEAFDRTFAAMTRADAGALLVLGDPMFFGHRSRLAEFAATSRLPAVYNDRAFVEAGGLLCYWANHPDIYRRAATYVDKILKGAKPADLPVEQPATFELVINLKTADALGLTIPPAVLFQATEIIR